MTDLQKRISERMKNMSTDELVESLPPPRQKRSRGIRKIF